jgi:hypothetical protein
MCAGEGVAGGSAAQCPQSGEGRKDEAGRTAPGVASVDASFSRLYTCTGDSYATTASLIISRQRTSHDTTAKRSGRASGKLRPAWETVVGRDI